MILKNPIILAIESSCDDTSAALMSGKKVLSNVTAGQDVHALYGGVVPEWASRAHQKNVVPVVDAAIKEANIKLEQIDAVAYTRGPGLLGSLLVGTSFAKSFAQALGIPILDVNHMQAHVLAHFIEDEEDKKPPKFPFVCLTVSGGHTQIVRVESPEKMIVVGETLDDAAGEAFDKAAKLLGMPYPGGPLVDTEAKEGDENAFKFTISDVPGHNYSFSGLKTNLLQFLQRQLRENPTIIEDRRADICASFQKAIIDTLMVKLIPYVEQEGIKEVALAGGVSANSGLRKRLKEEGISRGWNIHVPKLAYCTDNAAMIGITAYYQYLRGDFGAFDKAPNARWKLA